MPSACLLPIVLGGQHTLLLALAASSGEEGIEASLLDEAVWRWLSKTDQPPPV